MTINYRPGIKNIAAHIGVCLFSAGCLFYLIFIRPLAVGDADGWHTGGQHTKLSIVVTYIGFALLFLYTLYETVVMIRKRRRTTRAMIESSDME